MFKSPFTATQWKEIAKSPIKRRYLEIAFLNIINNRISRNIVEFHNSTFIKDEWIYKITRKPILIKS